MERRRFAGRKERADREPERKHIRRAAAGIGRGVRLFVGKAEELAHISVSAPIAPDAGRA